MSTLSSKDIMLICSSSDAAKKKSSFDPLNDTNDAMQLAYESDIILRMGKKQLFAEYSNKEFGYSGIFTAKPGQDKLETMRNTICAAYCLSSEPYLKPDQFDEDSFYYYIKCFNFLDIKDKENWALVNTEGNRLLFENRTTRELWDPENKPKQMKKVIEEMKVLIFSSDGIISAESHKSELLYKRKVDPSSEENEEINEAIKDIKASLSEEEGFQIRTEAFRMDPMRISQFMADGDDMNTIAPKLIFKLGALAYFKTNTEF